MNPPKYQLIDYSNSLIVTQTAYSSCEAERVHPNDETADFHATEPPLTV
ncbi:MAG: hypothetical protein AAGH67_13835 [Cyanobacteria bacterium P01_H01_bin.162]